VNFYIGNSDEATGIFYPPKGINLVTDDAVKEYVERVLARPLKPSELSGYWFREAFDFIRNSPGRELRLLLRKTGLFFNGYEVPQIEAYEIVRARFSTLRLLFVNFWWMLSLAAVGMIFLRRDWKKYFLLYGYVFAFAFSIILFFVTARYRVQLAPVLCLFAAHALLVLLPHAVLGARRRWLTPTLLVVILLATRPALFALPPEDVEWREITHEARRLSKIGKHEEAIAEINKAIDIHPNYADSYVNRALIYKDQGKMFQTIGDYNKAVQLNPRLHTVQYDLGQALRQMKMFEPAAEAYQAAIQINPLMLEAYNNLGITYRELKQYDKSIAWFEKVIERDPRYIKAYNNLGASLAESGDIDRAIGVLEEAIRVDPYYLNSYKNLAITYAQKGDVRKAASLLEHYVSEVPGDDRARTSLESLQALLRGDTLRTDPNGTGAREE
jgi:tetratricopeptide (TPR) repeat protein